MVMLTKKRRRRTDCTSASLWVKVYDAEVRQFKTMMVARSIPTVREVAAALMRSMAGTWWGATERSRTS